jgi:hypothetical protein
VPVMPAMLELSCTAGQADRPCRGVCLKHFKKEGIPSQPLVLTALVPCCYRQVLAVPQQTPSLPGKLWTSPPGALMPDWAAIAHNSATAATVTDWMLHCEHQPF